MPQASPREEVQAGPAPVDPSLLSAAQAPPPAGATSVNDTGQTVGRSGQTPRSIGPARWSAGKSTLVLSLSCNLAAGTWIAHDAGALSVVWVMSTEAL